MNVAVGVILTRKMTVSEVLYWTVVGPTGDSKPTQSTYRGDDITKIIIS